MSLLVTLRLADLGNWLAGVEKQTSGASRGYLKMQVAVIKRI